MLLPQRERKHFYVSGKNCCLLHTWVLMLCLFLMSVSSTCLYRDWKCWPSTCVSSNRVHWLYLFCHSGNQWSSYFCFTHHCGWVRVIVLKSLRMHSVSLRKLPPFDCLFLVHVRTLCCGNQAGSDLSRPDWSCLHQVIPSRWTCVQSTTTTSFSGSPSRCSATVSMAMCWQTARGRGGWVRRDMTCQVWGLCSSKLDGLSRLSPPTHINLFFLFFLTIGSLTPELPDLTGLFEFEVTCSLSLSLLVLLWGQTLGD